MRAWPLRWKLTLYTALLAGAVLVLFGIGVSLHLYRDGVEQLDADTTEVANLFFSEYRKRGRLVDWSSEPAVEQLFPNVRHLYYIEILHRGQVVFRSLNLHGAEFPAGLPAHSFESGKLRGHRVRFGTFGENDGCTLRLAVGMHQVEETREDLLLAFLTAGPVALLLVALGGWWIARHALAPVERIAAAAEQITVHRLDQRLPMPEAGDEIGRLTAVLNEMIDRLEASFAQATRFTADASHELKTPLTVLRGELEEALRARDVTPAIERLLVNLLDEVQRLVAITDGLLLLSQADAGRFRIERAPVDLSALLGELLEDAEILSASRGIRVDAEIAPGVTVQAHAQFLRQLVLNLFDNAVKYNRDGGELRVRLSAGAERHLLSVANTGATLTPAQAARVFDRFYRADQARDRRVGGHGLGLSICREIVRVHEGEIRVVVPGDAGFSAGWTEFRVALPASSAPAASEFGAWKSGAFEPGLRPEKK